MAWCAKLVKGGHIAEPPVYVLEDLLGRFERQQLDAASKRSPAGDRKSANLEKITAVLRAEVAKAKGEEVEQPVDENADLRARLEAAEAATAKAKAEAKAAKAKATKLEKAAAAPEGT